MGGPVTVVWFRRDLRLEDNPALISAARMGSVVPVFIWAPEEEGQFQPGRCSRWWLKQSLMHLDVTLQRMGAPLILRRSADSFTMLLDIVKETGATQVFYNHLYGRYTMFPVFW
jgi:cryptochrome 1